VTPYVVQLVVIGFLWVSFHCVGMCGPIVAGLTTANVDGESRAERLRSGVAGILAYQGGRAVTYALLGAAAGWLGGSVDRVVHGVGNIAALVVAVGLVGAGIARLVGWSADASIGGDVGGRLGRAARRLMRLAPTRGRSRLAVFGAVMGFLPCMLMFWVLGLAASTGGALTGAAVMVGLVVMTTPVLLIAGTSPLLARGKMRQWGDTVAALALLISGVWLGLVGAAANGWIDHLHFMFAIGDQSFKMMLW
jgi:hypothetical protein